MTAWLAGLRELADSPAPLLILQTQSTGPQGDVFEITALRFHPQRGTQGLLHVLLNPATTWSPEQRRRHAALLPLLPELGLPSIRFVAQHLEALCRSHRVVSWDAPFHERRLRATLENAGETHDFPAFHAAQPASPPADLRAACQQAGVDLRDLPEAGALSDALALSRLLHAAQQAVPVPLA